MTSPAARPPHVYPLTGNLLAERTLEFEDWKVGRTQRAVHETFQVGGKGINVARMLARLGAPHTALCFAGGPSGTECATWLSSRLASHRIFPTSVATRVGTVVRTRATAASPRPETTFLGPDAPPDAAAILACADFLDAQPDGQILAICGSVPGWAEERFDPLRSALQRWLARGHLVADTYGPALAWFATRALALIKINAHELGTIAAAHETSPPAPTERWVVTDGPGVVRVWDRAVRTEFQPPKIAEVSPTGSGDVLFACILHALFHGRKSLAEAVAYALPFAVANAAHPGIAEFPELPTG